MRTLLGLSILFIACLLSGCNNSPAQQSAVSQNKAVVDARPTPSLQDSAPIVDPLSVPFRLVDITRRAGLTFRHNNAAFGAALLPETMGSGSAFFDYDNDGDADIFLVNGRNWTQAEITAYNSSPVSAKEASFLNEKARRENSRRIRRAPPNKAPQRSASALYRNNGDGTFSDVSKNSGLDIPLFGMGAACGDYDNDGRIDVCVTSYGRLFLFRNLGNGRFREEATRAGTTDNGWSTCAVWFDYDRDGQLDLFVGRYLRWTPATDVFFSLDGRHKAYGLPRNFSSETSLLFRNLGNGRFANVSLQTGIARRLNAASTSKGTAKVGSAVSGAALGVLVCDPNRDGWPDVVVANDQRANFYFENRKNGTFHEIAAKNGLSAGQSGRARGGMGIDAADIDRSGRESVAIGHFNAENMGLWQNVGGAFNDIADQTIIGPASSTFLTFGLLFSDFNNDTWPDLLAANGHVDPTVGNYLLAVSYAERPLLFLNTTSRNSPLGLASQTPQFREIAIEVGLKQPLVARGLASADIDLDGDSDVLMTTNGGSPVLLRNEGGNQNNALRLVLRGQAPNRDAIGARIEARFGNETLHRAVRTGSSYLSQSELPLTLGLGAQRKIDALTIFWPNGKTSQFKNLATGRIFTLSQSTGIVRQQPLKP